MRPGCESNRLALGRSPSRTERAKTSEVVMRGSRGGDEEAIPQKRNWNSRTSFEISVDERSLCQSCSGDDQGRASDPSLQPPQAWPKGVPVSFNGSGPHTYWRLRVDETEHWQSDMADATAHIATARELIDGLLELGISSLPISTCNNVHEAARFAVRAEQALDAVSLRTWVGTTSRPERQRHVGSLGQMHTPVRKKGGVRN
jgi:hypothetical protein